MFALHLGPSGDFLGFFVFNGNCHSAKMAQNARKSVRNEHISAGTFPNHLCFNYLGVYEPLTPSGGNKRGKTCFPVATAIRRDEKSNLGVKWPILGQNMKILKSVFVTWRPFHCTQYDPRAPSGSHNLAKTRFYWQLPFVKTKSRESL